MLLRREKNYRKTKIYCPCYQFFAGVSYVAARRLNEILVYLTHLSARHTAVCSWKYIPLFQNRGDSYHFIWLMYFYFLLEKLKTEFPTTDSREWILPPLECNIVKYKFKITQHWQIYIFLSLCPQNSQHSFFRKFQGTTVFSKWKVISLGSPNWRCPQLQHPSFSFPSFLPSIHH